MAGSEKEGVPLSGVDANRIQDENIDQSRGDEEIGNTNREPDTSLQEHVQHIEKASQGSSEKQHIVFEANTKIHGETRNIRGTLDFEVPRDAETPSGPISVSSQRSIQDHGSSALDKPGIWDHHHESEDSHDNYPNVSAKDRRGRRHDFKLSSNIYRRRQHRPKKSKDSRPRNISSEEGSSSDAYSKSFSSRRGTIIEGKGFGDGASADDEKPLESSSVDAELLSATLNESIDEVRSLLGKGADVNAQDEDKDTPLHIAIMKKNSELIKILLDLGADVSINNGRGSKPLHLAAIGGMSDITKLLLEKGADVDARKLDGGTALQWASYHGRKKVVEILLQNMPPANPNARDNDGWTALYFAARHGHLEVVKLLLNYKADINARAVNEWTVLHGASSHAHKSLVSFLLKKVTPEIIAAKTSDGDTALHLVVRNTESKDSLEIAGLLCKAMSLTDIVSRDQKGATALKIASENFDRKMVNLLVHYKGDLIMASRNRWKAMDLIDQTAIGKLLLDAIDDFTKDNSSWRDLGSLIGTLHWAARNGRSEVAAAIVEIFIKKEGVNAPKNVEDCFALKRDGAEGYTALYWASVGGCQNIVEILLSSFDMERVIANDIIYDLWIKAINGAAVNGHLSIVSTLLKSFKRLSDEAQRYGYDPLFWAVGYSVQGGNKEIMKHILRAFTEVTKAPGEQLAKAVTIARSFREGADQKRNLRIDDIKELLENTRDFTANEPEGNLEKPVMSPASRKVCNMFEAQIMDFSYEQSGVITLDRSKNHVEDVVYERSPEKIASAARRNEIDKPVDPMFTWTHLPANNWIWVEDLMKTIYLEQKSKYPKWKNFMDENRREHTGKPEARFMFADIRIAVFDSGSKNPNNSTAHQDLARDTMTKQEAKTPDIKSANWADMYEKHEQQKEEQVKKALKDYGEKTNEITTKGMPILPFVQAPKHEFHHLQGTKLAAYMPYISFGTVRGQRAHQEAVRVAQAHRLISQIRESLNDETRSDRLDKKIREKIENIFTKDVIPLMEICGCVVKYLKDLQFTIETYPRDKQSIQKLLDTTLKSHRAGINPHLNAASEVSTYNQNDEAILSEEKSFWKRTRRYAELLKAQLFETNSLHITRTLDQYYYSALEDTQERDADQVILRYQRLKGTKHTQDLKSGSNTSTKLQSERPENKTGGRECIDLTDFKHNKDNYKVCIIDQLWLWVTDDRTIITCFPPRWDEKITYDSEAELVKRLKKAVKDAGEISGSQISSVYHMAKVIISLCANFVDECDAEVPDGKEPLLQIFASSIGTVSHEETRLFKSFKQAVEKRETEQKVGNGKHKETALTALLEELYLHKEIELMEEIKDIRDELKIIRGVFEEQKYVLQGLSKALVEGQKETNSDALYSNLPELNNLITRLEQVEKMEEDAKTTYKSLNHLLDLKQKQANLIEAAGARSEAVESGKQAKTVLFFTIVTIIFLPLSFLTSLFALNIKDFPHDASGEVLFPSRWIYSRIFGTTAAIAVPMIGIAISINNLLDMFKKENVKKNIKTARTETFPRIRRWFARTDSIEYDAEKLK